MKTSDYAKTLILVAVVLFVAFQSDFGFVVLFLLPILFVWFIVGIVLMVRRPQERQRRAIRMAIWASTLVIIGTVQGHRADAARAEANGVVRALIEYKALNG